MNGFPEALSLREVPVVGNTVLILFVIQIKGNTGLSLSLSHWLPVRCGKKHASARQGWKGWHVVVNFPSEYIEPLNLRHRVGQASLLNWVLNKPHETPWASDHICLSVFLFHSQRRTSFHQLQFEQHHQWFCVEWKQVLLGAFKQPGSDRSSYTGTFDSSSGVICSSWHVESEDGMGV